MYNRILLILACVLLVFISPVAANAETGQSNSQFKTKQQLESDLSQVKQQKLQVQEEIEATTKKITELDSQIAQSNDQLQKKEKELADCNMKMERLNKENKRIAALLNSREKGFRDRVSSYYRTEGQMSFFNVIFSVNSFGEFIDHFVVYNKIVKKDKEYIEEYIADQNKVANIKESVAKLQASAVREKTELEAIKADQEYNKKEKESLSAFLEDQKKQLEKEEQEKSTALQWLTENEKVINDLINNGTKPSEANIQMIKSIIAPFVPDAQRLQQEKGIPASITLGQIILESSGSYNGLSGLAYGAKNLFGIKGTGTAGSVSMSTTEYINGQAVTTTAAFASYTTYYDSMVDHADLLLKPRYQKYLKNVTNIIDYAHGIQDAGYATDPNYADKLLKIIYQYELWKLDV